MPSALAISAERCTFPIAGAFRIARGARAAAETVVCTVGDGIAAGRGECVPYARYGESVDSVLGQIAALPPIDAAQADPHARLSRLLAPGAARNALDCALWDWRAKRAGVPVHALAGLPAPHPVPTALTISLDAPAAMAEATRKARGHELLKLKLGGDGGDIARMRAVAEHAAGARLIVDANESWTAAELPALMDEAARLGVALIEQPLPAGADMALAGLDRKVPVCADESAHDSADLAALRARYDVVNIKLDKTGGLTEAIVMRERARALGFGVMVGCMLGSSLAMAPAVLVARDADFVDLDGPLLLAADLAPALRYDGGMVHPPEPALWG
ncbi:MULTISPECIES: N-acetyl-D-Glu racemase DgcA [unclassified Roseitalea]|uniref:N-acetyl-D-Glu racemase DgcA n=1 Tax=unclassified Roseitalea TaxID=2639107 RepID=UPI00273ED922|nr:MULTISPECIES: N-acetyl-D-Glu racemase DgcA [unclassified Roseitalea]